MKPKIAVLTGAGMSADSGLKTFRDANGLWEGHDVMSVASPEGFAKNPSLVLEFYNQRRRQLRQAHPNPGHLALHLLEGPYDVTIITQNVDDLHERAGNTKVLHLHGELLKVRSTGNESHILDWETDLNLGDTCEAGHQLRPHIVWFGEEVPLLMEAAHLVSEADIVLIIGTSLQVYPAAGLIHYARPDAQIIFVDPRPTLRDGSDSRLQIIAETAALGVPPLVQKLLQKEDRSPAS